jgi:hypothetical protein
MRLHIGEPVRPPHLFRREASTRRVRMTLQKSSNSRWRVCELAARRDDGVAANGDRGAWTPARQRPATTGRPPSREAAGGGGEAGGQGGAAQPAASLRSLQPARARTNDPNGLKIFHLMLATTIVGFHGLPGPRQRRRPVAGSVDGLRPAGRAWSPSGKAELVIGGTRLVLTEDVRSVSLAEGGETSCLMTTVAVEPLRRCCSFC